MQKAELAFPSTLLVTEQAIDISGFSARQKDFYARLFEETLAIYRARNKDRVIIGFAGPTGAGKSVVAVLLKELARQAGLPFAFEVVTIDAYHYPNHFLCANEVDGEPLKKVKGRFDTYDVGRLACDLKAFAAGENVLFPIYSRKLHDPVPGRIQIHTRAVLLLVEGLWLLSDLGGWGAVRPLLDFSFFLDADKEQARGPVIQRHLRGGRSLGEATKHYEQVDARNFDWVMQTRDQADKIIPPYYRL